MRDIYLWLYSPLLDLDRFFSFFIFYIVRRTPSTGDQPVARPLPALRTAQTQNKNTHTTTPQVWFEPTTPMFERTKTVHVLDLTAAVIGHIWEMLVPYSKREQHSGCMRVDNEGYLNVGVLDSNYIVGNNFLCCLIFLPLMLYFLGSISKNRIHVLHIR
jgi:hypothetical protein